MALPAAKIFSKEMNPEQERLVSYWQELASGRKFPLETEINTRAISDLWTSCFLLNTHKHSDKDYRYEFMGPSLIEAFGADLTGQAHTEGVEPQIPSIFHSFEQVVGEGVVVVDASEFTNKDGKQITYECCLVPFGKAPDHVNYILGLMRCVAH